VCTSQVSSYQEFAEHKQLDWIKKENHDMSVIILASDDHIDFAVKDFQHGGSDYVVKSETKFKKINYSIFNALKLLEARSEAKKYKRLAIGLFLSIALIVIGVTVVQFFMPSLFR
jgi:DNA-binding NtrC family response regulator